MGNPPNALTKGSVLKALVTFTVPFFSGLARRSFRSSKQEDGLDWQ